MDDRFEIFLACAPGLEPLLLDEARAFWPDAAQVAGGVTITGGWPDVWQANLNLRGATRVLARIGSFRALHLAQLDKRARKFDWGAVLRRDVPVRVDTTCRASRIYHAGAASQRIARAIAEELGAPVVEKGEAITVKARIEDDLVTISVDTSGESLHKRGHKPAVSKAPMRETLAALFLRDCGYTGAEPVLDPMCGSGTFIIEAAEIAAGLQPGRTRDFAFQQLATADAAALASLRQPTPAHSPAARFYGSDRDAGAIRAASQNAQSAGVGAWCDFQTNPVSALERPDGPPGLVIVNPPYGTRIGNKGPLFGLHAALGKTLLDKFSGWRVGIVTSESGLARATALPLLPPGPIVDHGGLKIRLHRTNPLP
ncbi:MAG: class I SAM-dependent RNA methyltransferase [Paracoccus sp. (in: a-proteobacteria)]|uniref:THUMP domain-containing class I SAM-dependent RNA methyltransferase n=1 Tax=Paracoccus sp. TaxID=267 RepID=UPI0026DF8204|nr:class I SAM-dependent RNA methyltransferase [Paracoccus sp. (in: a-proteobacteria)]MDO5612346.1 class I SAM-dependent RNA methyltransferase [Paracoccus sp. (in: a-proteobacteria)]